MNLPVTRRSILKGSLGAAISFALPGCASSQDKAGPLVGFAPVPMSAGDGLMPLISSDYEYQVLIPWGTPLSTDSPAFNYPPGAVAQASQVGIGHDGMAFFPLQRDGQRGLLAINHEYGRNPHVLGKADPQSLDDVRASQHAHGLSVVEIANVDGTWQSTPGLYNRRIHANSPMDVAGPLRNHPLLKNPADNPVLGTLSNCANGRTPWGTYLTCEENFNLYFGAKTQFTPDAKQQRFGFSQQGGGYSWYQFDSRFDLNDPVYVHEPNRFGWVVELDPQSPQSNPVKRTALGRFKHESAAVVEGRDGRVVVYMGDDQRFEFIYKFVSAYDWREMRERGISPLDEGTLYVARFDEGGRGHWLPLTQDNPALEGEYQDLGELLVNARFAATRLGATPMDRPEWTSVGPGGHVYCTLTNNHLRQTPNAANPMAPNPHGSIVRWMDADEHVGTTFSWEHFLIAADHYETQQSFGSPDGLWADPDGRVFIATDGSQRGDLPNQLLVVDAKTREISRLLTGVKGCEITGLTTTPDRRTLFVNVQHPGNGDPVQTNFPLAYDGKTVPRDATLAIRRRDGGIVGS